jgi:hypothetical protein
MVSPERHNSGNGGESSLISLDDVDGPAPPVWVMLILPEMVFNNLKFLPTYAAAADLSMRFIVDSAKIAGVLHIGHGGSQM